VAKQLGLRGVAAQRVAQPFSSADAAWHAPVADLPDAVRSEVAHAAACSGRHVAVLSAALSGIVSRASRRQAVAGLLAAGPWKAAAYVGSKVRKSLASTWRGLRE